MSMEELANEAKRARATVPCTAGGPGRQRQALLTAAAVVAALGVFAADCATPLGLLAPALYIAVVALSGETEDQRTVWAVTGLCLVLLVAGAFASGDTMVVSRRQAAAINRSLIALLILGTAGRMHVAVQQHLARQKRRGRG